MRYAIYALLVLFGIGGIAIGSSNLVNPRTEAAGVLYSLIGVVALGSLGVVMAIEHVGADLRELRRLATQQEKRAQAMDAARVAPVAVVPQGRPSTEK